MSFEVQHSAAPPSQSATRSFAATIKLPFSTPSSLSHSCSSDSTVFPPLGRSPSQAHITPLSQTQTIQQNKPNTPLTHVKSNSSLPALQAAEKDTKDISESKESLAVVPDVSLSHGGVEAQWVLSVLDDAINKLTMASFLTNDILKDKICDTLDQEMIIALREHFQVESQYHEFLESDLYKLGSSDPKNQELFRELDLCLGDSTRTVTRLLKNHPALIRRLRDLSGKRPSSSLDFINCMSRLRILMHGKLKMSAEEERNRREQLNELKAAEEEDTTRFIELTERLAVERNEHEQSLQNKDKKIQRLQQQIEQLQSRTQQERIIFEKKMQQENENAERMFKQSEKDLLKQLDTLSHQFDADSNENFRAELLYHRRKNLRALDVSNLIEKYDVDMTLKHESVVDMEAVYKREKAELDNLTGYFKNIDAEQKRIADEHEDIHQKRDAELLVERRIQQAGLLVQQLYKPYYSKVGPKEPKKKGKKKKGGGSAKKKKQEAAANSSANASAVGTARSTA